MELLFKLKKSPEFIFDYLTDMQKFVSVHPVIYQIDNTSYNSYVVHEMLRIWVIPISFTYPVTIEKNIIDQVVIIRATVFNLTHIEMKFIITTQGDYTLIEENIQFKSPLPVKFIMQSIFRKQHSQLFKNIEMK
jgi:hypothetical protein